MDDFIFYGMGALLALVAGCLYIRNAVILIKTLRIGMATSLMDVISIKLVLRGIGIPFPILGIIMGVTKDKVTVF